MVLNTLESLDPSVLLDASVPYWCSPREDSSDAGRVQLAKLDGCHPTSSVVVKDTLSTMLPNAFYRLWRRLMQRAKCVPS